jgi:hypothetical protein
MERPDVLQVRYEVLAEEGRTLVQITPAAAQAGDGVVFTGEIELLGVHHLSAADFILGPPEEPRPPPAGPAVDLAAIAAGVGGFRIVGEAQFDRAGISFAAIRDLNGDSLSEVLVSATGNDAAGDDAGAGYVVWGKADGAPVDLAAVADGRGGYKILGEGPFVRAGRNVAAVGDLNGDGLDEPLLSAITFRPDGTSVAAAYVVWGKADGAPVDLGGVAAGRGGYRIVSETEEDDAFGVASIGDLNGDGRPEILLGHSHFGQAGEGAAYVVWGKTDGAPVDLAAVADGRGGFRILGEAPFDGAGASVAPIRDLNDDSLPEILVGATANDAAGENAGAAYVVWGKADGARVDLGEVAAGRGGFKILGEPRGVPDSSGAGFPVAAIGDLNGDGRDEILIGAPSEPDGQRTGAAYVVWGKADGALVSLGEVAAGRGGFKILGEAASDALGGSGLSYSLAAVGDLNGDGLPEVSVGAHGNDAGGRDAGAAYVVWGKADGARVDLGEVAAGNGGVKIVGEDADDLAGFHVAAAGDLDGDGRDEILVGAPNSDAAAAQAGVAYVVHSDPDWIGAV